MSKKFMSSGSKALSEAFQAFVEPARKPFILLATVLMVVAIFSGIGFSQVPAMAGVHSDGPNQNLASRLLSSRSLGLGNLGTESHFVSTQTRVVGDVQLTGTLEPNSKTVKVSMKGALPTTNTSPTARGHATVVTSACPQASGGTVITNPVISNISPTYGPSGGGTQVTLSGVNLGGACDSVAPNTESSQTTVVAGVSITTTTVTSTVTTFEFSAYGVTFTYTTSSGQITLGSPEILSDNGLEIVALTPPGPLCSAISATQVTASVQIVQQTATYTSIWVGSVPPAPFPTSPNPMTCIAASTLIPPPTSCNSTDSAPSVSDVNSTSTQPIIFTYINEGPQVLSCGTSQVPYDIANGNAVVKQMSAELSADVNVERTSRGLMQLSTSSYLQNIANTWADEQAAGITGGSSGSGGSSVTESDACILQEVAASGYTSGSSSLWAAENGGVFSGPASTGQMNAVFVKSVNPEPATSLSGLGSQGNCQSSGTGSGGSGGSGGGTGGATIANTSTSQNILSTTFNAMGVGVACNGSASGTCYVAEVFAGPGPLLPAQAPGNAVVSSGGTQALDVLPAAPIDVKASIAQEPGDQFLISATWQPPPAEGFDPVNSYQIEFYDMNSGLQCSGMGGANILAFSATGCIINSSYSPFSTDSYEVTVSAVNDLCQTSCFPQALYPTTPPPGSSNGCDPYGSVFFPFCSPAGASPSGPNQIASPYILQVSGVTGNNGNPNPGLGSGDSYRFVAADGGVFTFGQDSFYGSMGGRTISGSMVAIAPTPDGGGYWTVSSGGGVYAFGDANFYGSTGGVHLVAPVIAMAVTPDGGGYWLAASDGGVFAFGDAEFYGSAGARSLDGPIEGFVTTPDGKGYWMVTSQGTVYGFGDAALFGSISPSTSHATIVGMARTIDGRGYWLVGQDGSVYSFGDAQFYGNALGSTGSNQIIGIFATQSGNGYWLLTQSGGLVTFGDATFSGSVQTLNLAAPVVSMEVG